MCVFRDQASVRWLFAIGAALAIACSPATADELRLDATRLFERSITKDVRLTTDAGAIELGEGVLIEDDGPAAGYSFRPNEERLSDSVRVRKQLVIPKLAPRAATLLVGPGGMLKGTVNGAPVELTPEGMAGKYWQRYPVPIDLLREGKNDVVLWGAGKVWIARSEDFAAGSTDRPRHPGRSAKSADGGASWADDRLGPDGTIGGEYCVRLFLDQHRAAGSLVLPVMDAGNLAESEIAPAVGGPIPVRVGVDAEGDGLRVSARTGPSPVVAVKEWSEWRDVEAGEIGDPKGRYFQLRIELAARDPRRSPRLRSVAISATPTRAEDWSRTLKVAEASNAAIVRTSIAFADEAFDHPRLKELRAAHRLDEVVAGAKTELETIERLARWSAARWERGHLSESYPAWDALEILKTHADGTPVGGFCQQYNVVFLQACQSFGIPGRAVSISAGDHGAKVPGSGHEVVEIWSNQFSKWIYVDGNMAWYAVDEESGKPLSLRELRGRQLDELAERPGRATRTVHLRETGKRWNRLTEWPPFAELRLIPRSNFLAQKSPLPLHQGMRGWFWTGHHVWTDAESPASLLYSERVGDPHNWDWTLNQARYRLEATKTPGELRVHLDTVTPGFETFMARVDGDAEKRVDSGFVWTLKPGRNRLEVRARNILGREGPSSVAVIDSR